MSQDKDQPHLKLFTTGFIQVVLVAINTWQIANEKYLGAFVVAFFISLTWTYNVKKISISSMSERVTYSLGASCGCVLGLVIAKMIYL